METTSSTPKKRGPKPKKAVIAPAVDGAVTEAPAVATTDGAVAPGAPKKKRAPKKPKTEVAPMAPLSSEALIAEPTDDATA